MSYGVIYKITNKLDGKCYIGKSIHLKERIRVHTKRFSPLEYNFEILAEYESKEELVKAELHFVEKYDALDNGYNKKKITIKRKGFKQIGILVSDSFSKSIEECCEKYSLTMSDYVRALIRDDLIKKKIIKEVIDKR